MADIEPGLHRNATPLSAWLARWVADWLTDGYLMEGQSFSLRRPRLQGSI